MAPSYDGDGGTLIVFWPSSHEGVRAAAALSRGQFIKTGREERASQPAMIELLFDVSIRAISLYSMNFNWR